MVDYQKYVDSELKLILALKVLEELNKLNCNIKFEEVSENLYFVSKTFRYFLVLTHERYRLPQNTIDIRVKF